MSGDRIADVKAHGVARVARAFGFTVMPDPTSGQPPKAVSPCPACGDHTRHHKTKDRRGAVGLTRNGAGWRCFQCDASGDAFGLAAWAVLKRAPRRGDARQVLAACVGLGLCDDLTGDTSARGVVRRTAFAPRPEAPHPERPPRDELAALWDASHRLDAVPSDLDPEWTGEARAYLAGRGLDVGILATLDMARVLPPPTRIAWPAWWPYTSKVWRAAVPLFDAAGTMVSMQARALTDARPKDRNARGYSVAELVFASPLGRAFLAGDREGLGLEAVVITEGLTDTLKVAAWLHLQRRRVAVLGVVNGSAPLFAAVNWPTRLPCWIATDADETGATYARKLLEHLPEHVPCERITWGGNDEVAS